MIGLGATVGNYQVVKKLGSGAMGTVYLAEHPRIGKRVALKAIHPDLAENPEMLSRFFNEARSISEIGHENIVEVLDFGQTSEGDNFIVMELLEGGSLGDLLKAQAIMSVEQAIRIAIQITQALEASHTRGIIHRDLKPDNVYLIRRHGLTDFVKILDFGLAKLTGGKNAFSHHTRIGSVLGTPHYMAPEQCEGKPDIDHRVDVYALGCLMYQMLCGRVPFPGDGFGEVLVKHLREPPQLPRQLNPLIPEPVERIMLHALAKRKEFRFQSMKLMGDALRDPERYARSLAGEESLSVTTGEMEAISLGDGAAKKPEASAATQILEAPAAVQQAARREPPPSRPVDETPIADRATVISGEAPRVPTTAVRLPKRAPRRDGRLALVGGVAAALLVMAVGAQLLFGRSSPPPSKLVVVTSEPAGAEVLRDGVPVGKTPVALKVATGSPPVSLVVRKDGFSTATRTVDGSRDLQVAVQLEAAAPPPPPSAPPPPAAPKVEVETPRGAAPATEPPVRRPPRKSPHRKPPQDDDVLAPSSF